MGESSFGSGSCCLPVSPPVSFIPFLFSDLFQSFPLFLPLSFNESSSFRRHLFPLLHVRTISLLFAQYCDTRCSPNPIRLFYCYLNLWNKAKQGRGACALSGPTVYVTLLTMTYVSELKGLIESQVRSSGVLYGAMRWYPRVV